MRRQQGQKKAFVSWKESAEGLYVMNWVSWAGAVVHTVFIVLLVCLFSVFFTLMSQSRAGRNPAVCAVVVFFSISTVFMLALTYSLSVPRVSKGAVHTSCLDLHSGHFRKAQTRLNRP